MKIPFNLFILGLLFLATTLFAANPDHSNTFTLGDGLGSNKTFKADVGFGSTNPKFRYNFGALRWEFSNDGTTFDPMGTGSGTDFINSVASISIPGDNQGFESGASVWTVTGGTFTADTSTPIYGSTSGVFTASGSGQFFQSPLRAIPIGLYGQNCELDFSYKYAGTSGDYEARVFDGTSNVKVYALPTASSPTDVSIVFTCPSSGSLRVRFASTVASPGALTVDGYSKNYGLVALSAQHPGSPKMVLRGDIFGCTGTQDTTSTTFVDFPSQTGCTWNEYNNTGFGSISAAAVGFGPTLTFPRLGLYEVCVSFAALATANGYEDQLVYATNTVIVVGSAQTGTSAYAYTELCGFYTATSTASSVTFKIQGRAVVTGTHTVFSQGPGRANWKIREL